MYEFASAAFPYIAVGFALAIYFSKFAKQKESL